MLGTGTLVVVVVVVLAVVVVAFIVIVIIVVVCVINEFEWSTGESFRSVWVEAEVDVYWN